MNTCIKCGRPIADGELFCTECSLNPYDFTDDAPAHAAPKVQIPGRLQAPVRQPKAPAAAPPAPAPRKKPRVSMALLALLTLASLAFAGWCLLKDSSRRAALTLREEAVAHQEADFAALQTERDALADELSAANDELSTKNDLIKTLQENINTAESAASQTQYDLTTQQNELEKLSQSLEDKQSELNALQQQYDALLTSAASDRQAADFLRTYVVLVENDSTGLYHRYGCPNFAGKTFWAYSRKLAEKSGFKPCPNCIP